MSEAEVVAQESEEMEVVPSTPEQTMETETEPETKEEPKVEADAEKETEEEEKEPEEEKAEEEETEPEKEKTDEEPVQPKEKRGRLSRAAKESAKKVDTPKTHTRARQAKQKVPEKKEEPKEETPLGKRKRTAVQQAVQTPQASAKKGKKVHSLHFEDFITWEAGSRVLACGEGEQLGHPGRTTSKKPRKVDVIEDENLKIVQVVAGGVHSVILAETGEVYSCGINEKGTVPAEGVEAEGSTDEYTKIVFSDELQKEGKIVMLSAGASFTAALTNHGTVIAWGNLRDGSGKMDVHPQLIEMQKNPIIILRHKPGFSIVKIAAGENHLVMLSDDGRVFTFGDFSMGQLGRSNRLDRIRTQYIAADSESSLHVTIMDKRKKAKCKNVFAGGFWSAFLTEDDKLFVCGLNNFGHLGIAIDEPEAKDSSDDSGDDTELRILLPQFSPELSGHNWTHIEGVQHLVLRDSNGDIYCIGKNTDNALGLGSWSNSDKDKNWRYQTLQKLEIADSAGVTAQLGCSLAWNQKGSAVAWGYDSSGQLGLGLKDDDDRVVPKPDEISSAHLEGFKIVQVSVADNHAIFLAAKN